MKKESINNTKKAHDLLWGYLFIKKNKSQRQISLKVSQKLKEKNVHLSMESVQRLFTGLVKHVDSKVIAVLYDLYFQENFGSQSEINLYVKKHLKDSKDVFALVSSQKVITLSDLWLYVSDKKSKRQLAIVLKNKLKAQGYEYNMGSLQNIMCGKIKETRQLVVMTLNDILLEYYNHSQPALDEVLLKTTTKDNTLYKQVSTEPIKEMCQKFLSRHSDWSKRQLAIALADALKKMGYHISYNSLQYVLAGKRQTAKKIIKDKLNEFLSSEPEMIKTKTCSSVELSNHIKTNLSRSYHMVNQAKTQNKKKELENIYFDQRKEALKSLWARRGH